MGKEMDLESEKKKDGFGMGKKKMDLGWGKKSWIWDWEWISSQGAGVSGVFQDGVGAPAAPDRYSWTDLGGSDPSGMRELGISCRDLLLTFPWQPHGVCSGRGLGMTPGIVDMTAGIVGMTAGIGEFPPGAAVSDRRTIPKGHGKTNAGIRKREKQQLGKAGWGQSPSWAGFGKGWTMG